MDDRWLSVDEICAHLGVSRDTIYKWIDKKSMPAHRVGRLWKFKKAEVDAWVRAGGAGKGNGAPDRGESGPSQASSHADG
ncbi:MAG: helix-turn-helix domain-containing protein [Phycisphaerae bacterium]